MYVIFLIKPKKLPFFAVLIWFLILGKSKFAAKMATIVGDVTGLQQCHHPWNIPHLVKKVKGFPLKVKSFQNTATNLKLRRGVPCTPPPPLYHGEGMNLPVHPRVKMLCNLKFPSFFVNRYWHELVCRISRLQMFGKFPPYSPFWKMHSL